MNVLRHFILLFLFFVGEVFGTISSLKELQTAWGLPGHTAVNRTVFGLLSQINADVASSATNPLDRFKNTLLGQYDGDFAEDALLPFSLFSECVEIGRFLKTFEGTLSEQQRETLTHLIGAYDDQAPTTLFGALKKLLENVEENYETLIPLIGVDSENDVSVFHFLRKIQATLLPEAFGPLRETMPFLTNVSLQTLNHSSPSSLLSVLREEAKLRLTGSTDASLIGQLRSLQHSLSFIAPDLNLLIGSYDPSDCDSPTLMARLNRLALDIDFASVEHISELYTSFFYGGRSFQTLLNEVKDTAASSRRRGFSKVGTPLRFDASLFGLLNTSLQTLEVEPTLQLLNGLADSEDASTIFDLLKSIYQINWDDVELERLLLTLGREDKSGSLSVPTFLSALSYAIDSWKQLALLEPREALLQHRTLLSENLFKLARQVSTCTKIDTFYVLCGGTKDVGTETLFGIVHTLLNDLTENLLKTLDSAPLTAPALDPFFAKYKETHAALESVMRYYNDSLLRLKFRPFLKKLWDGPAPAFDARTTLDVSPFEEDNVSDDLQDDLPFFFRLQALATASATDETSQTALEVAFEEALHAVALGFVLDCLKEQIPEKLEAATSALRALNLFEKSLTYIGTAEEAAPFPQTIYSLLAQITELLSDPTFFSTALRSYLTHPSSLSSFNLFSIFSLLGSPHDTTEQSLTERSFFATIDHLQALARHAAPATQRDNVAATIGLPDAEPEAKYHSLFSLAHTMVAYLFENAVPFFLRTEKQATSESTSLVDSLADLLSEAHIQGYLATPIGAPLARLGLLEERTGVFGSLLELYEKVTSEKMPSSFQYNFLLTARALSKLIHDFQEVFPPNSPVETETFCAQACKLVRQLDFVESCEACDALAELLQIAGQRLTEWSALSWTEKAAETVFAQSSFMELSDAVQELATTFESFTKILQTHMDSTCLLKGCLNERMALAEALESIQDAVQNLMKTGNIRCSSATATLPSFDEGCVFLPIALKQFTEGLKTWSQSWVLPPQETYVYDANQEKAWKAIARNVQSIAKSLEDFLAWAEQQKLPNLCPSCHLDGWADAMTSIQSILPSFVQQIQNFSNFFVNAPKQRLTAQWERIVVLLQKRRKISLGKEDLWEILNTAQAIEFWEDLAQSLEAVAQVLPQTLTASHKGNADQTEAAFVTLEETVRQVLKAWQHLRALFQAPLLETALLSERSEKFGDSLESLLEEMAQNVTFDENLADMLITAVTHSEPELETAEVIIPLQRLAAVYQQLATIAQEEAAFSQTPKAFPYNLYSVSTCQTFLEHLSTLSERFNKTGCVFKQVAQELKQRCPREAVALLQTLTLQEKRLAILIGEVPDSFWQDFTDVQNFVSAWAEKMEVIARLGERMVEEGKVPETDKRCLHFTLKASWNRLGGLADETIQQLVDITGELDPGLSALEPSSALEAQTFFESAFAQLTGCLQQTLKRIPPLTHCSRSLSNAFLSLRDSWNRLAKSFELLGRLSLCAVEEELTLPKIELLQARAYVWNQSHAYLISDLQCAAENEAALKSLWPLVDGVVQGVLASLTVPPSIPELVRQATALEDLNVQTASLNTLFQNSKGNVCLSQLTPFLKNIESSLKQLRNIFPSFETQTLQSTGLATVVEAFVQPLRRLKQSVLVTLAQTPVPVFNAEEELLAFQNAFQKMTKAVQGVVQNARCLSQTFYQSVPQIACFGALGKVSKHLNSLAQDESLIANALEVHLLKINECLKPFVYERYDAAIEPPVLYDGMNQHAWLKRTRLRQHNIQHELENLQKIIGFCPPTCAPKHSLPLEFATH